MPDPNKQKATDLPQPVVLFMQCHQGNLTPVKLIIKEKLVDIYSPVKIANIEYTYVNSAIQGNHLEIVEALIEGGSPLTLYGAMFINKGKHFYGSALHAAVFYERIPILARIIDQLEDQVNKPFIQSNNIGRNLTPILFALMSRTDSLELV